MAICTNAIPLTAHANSPVVIEFFGNNNCKTDPQLQKFLQETLKTESNIIIIDCRVRYDKTEKQKTENKKFSHSFCTERLFEYIKRFREIDLYSTASIIVNGHLDANANDIMPAIKYARTDNIKTIPLELDGNILNISIPKTSSETNLGKIILHTYNISSDDKELQPFETSTSPDITNTFYLRPTISIEIISEWNGETIDISHSLNHIESLAKLNYKDFGYIVTLHENDSYGKILAAGELIPIEEMNKTLLISSPNLPYSKNNDSKTVQARALESDPESCACSTPTEPATSTDQEL